MLFDKPLNKITERFAFCGMSEGGKTVVGCFCRVTKNKTELKTKAGWVCANNVSLRRQSNERD